MAKRKRPVGEEPQAAPNGKSVKSNGGARLSVNTSVHIQIVVGSYERVLHGITASLPTDLLQLDSAPKEGVSVSFADSFLFNAHLSAIRCLALSPPPSPASRAQKIFLASGGTDQRVNIYQLSTKIPRGPRLPSLNAETVQNPDNRSLGSLHSHDATITALHFPNRSKLLSACANNVIAINTTRDWTALSLIKAPKPKHPNRPTGDTSTASTLPAGVNDFAVHPSMKLMISVGRAERCMRLWNLVTGKKAGVLSFEKDVLKELGESLSRWGSGEASKVVWDAEGEEFAVAFERGVCIFGLVSGPSDYAATATRLILELVLTGNVGLQTSGQGCPLEPE
jgi:protein MAK11